MELDLSSKSTAELEAMHRVFARKLATQQSREHLLDFIKFTMPDPEDDEDATLSLFRAAAHHKLFCEAVERVERGECLRLAVSVPPQHGKTETMTKRFPAWFMGRHPHKHLMAATYNQDYANDIGAEVREIMTSAHYKLVFPDLRFRKGSSAKDYMVTSKGGRMSFIGRGGAGTGKPADLIVIDDPLKNAQEAESPATRKELHEWFSKVIYTRARATTAIIIIQTRWHEDDLIGRLCDPDHPDHDPEWAKEWTYVNIPAVIKPGPIAEALGVVPQPQSDEEVRRQFGDEPMEALWPQEFSLRHLASAKRLNPLGFNALYMGKPTPDDGYYFKMEDLVTYEPHEMPKNLRIYGASDHAVSEKQEADSTVIGCVGVDSENDIWVLPDVVWDRMETDQTVEEMLAQMQTHSPLLWWMESELISKSFGPFLKKRMVEERVYTAIDPVGVSKDKRTRARSIQGRMRMRKVRFPRFAPWWVDAKAQLLKFPFAAHDDFVDWLAHIGQGLLKEVSASRPEPDYPGDNVIRIGDSGSPAAIRMRAKWRRDREAREARTAGW